MTKEWRALVAEAERQGWRVKELRKHAVMLLAPDGMGKVTLAATPSDWRAMEKVISRMRRHGFQWRGR